MRHVNSFLLVLLLIPSCKVNASGGVVDGQPVNAATTNSAFIFKNADDGTAHILSLTNNASASGSSVTNVQREHNSAASFMGKSLNSSKNDLPVWINNDVGSSSDTLKTRADVLTQRFNSTIGHTHDGTSTNGPLIQQLGAQVQDLNMNSHKVVNVTNPSSAQDAATKNYVDSATGNNANKSLNNLTNPTALNQDLLPAVSDVGSVGTGAMRFHEMVASDAVFNFIINNQSLSEDLVLRTTDVVGTSAQSMLFLGGAATGAGNVGARIAFVPGPGSGGATDGPIQLVGVTDLFNHPILDISTVLIGTSSLSTNASIVANNGHYKTSQTTAPTAAPTGNAGTGATCSVTHATDTAGTINLTTTGVLSSSGDVCDVTFNKVYNVAPICVFTAANANAILDAVIQGVYLNSSTSALSINFANTDAIGRSYVWNYNCVETQ